MCEFSQCHQVAMRKVIDAIRLIRDGNGSTKQDIYFVLDSLHGRVQRHVIKHAIDAAVEKGMLNCKNNRYKVSRTKTSVRVPRRRSMPGYAMSRCALSRCAFGRYGRPTARPSRVYRLLTNHGTRCVSSSCVPVRAPISRRTIFRKPYARRSRRALTEASSCTCCSTNRSTSTVSSASTATTYQSQLRKKATRRNSRKMPLPKVEVKKENESKENVQEQKTNTEAEKPAESSKPEEVVSKTRGILRTFSRALRFQEPVAEQAPPSTSAEPTEEVKDEKSVYFTRSKVRGESQNRSRSRSPRRGKNNKAKAPATEAPTTPNS